MIKPLPVRHPTLSFALGIVDSESRSHVGRLDLYIFGATALKIDLSSLTGESEPQDRSCALEGDKSSAAEATNLAFNSTLVVAGEAWGVVVRTGDHTFIGQIASLTSGENNNKSPLAVEIDAFVRIISCVAIFTAVLFFIIGITSVYKGKATATVGSPSFVLATGELD